jgi:sugar/nucleoside kinase (ribokinase family)
VATVLVIGSVNRDTVILPGRRPIAGFGGILYNIFGLSQLLDRSSTIIPVCNVGRDSHDDVMVLLENLPNVETSNIKRVEGDNNHCKLTYSDTESRSEIFTGFVPAISFSRIEELLSADIVIINFISGRDITLKTLKRIRKSCCNPIYMDFHTLSLGLKKDGSRYLRRPKRWREYVKCCDYLQMNSVEFELLSSREPNHDGLKSFYDSYLSDTCRALLVTFGSRGAAIVVGNCGAAEVRFDSPSRKYRDTDSTGAGDLFTAGFCAGLVSGLSLEKCLRVAVEAGSHVCTVMHPQDMKLSNLEL